MTNYDQLGPGGGGYLRLIINDFGQNVSLNQSTIGWELHLICGNGISNNGTPTNAIVKVDGAVLFNGSYTYDFSLYSDKLIAQGFHTVNHNSDGTKTIFVEGYTAHTGSSAIGGPINVSGSFGLPTIPRATQPSVSPTSGNTGTSYTITHTPATSTFYHDVAYGFAGQAGSFTNIATNVVGTTTTTAWNPAHTLLPNDASKTATIRVITRQTSGGTIIGTKYVDLPLTVPSSVVPTISAVAWADAQVSSPNMPSLMGGAGRFVQGWSKLTPTVTSAGAGGSTIVSSKVTQNGQITDSGVAFGLPITLSGSVPFTAQVTDSRARVNAAYASTVAVTAYNYPNLPTPLVVRTSDAAGLVPSPTGTYLAINPAASVSSLNFSGEKNLLEWQVRIKPAGGAYSTVQAWTSSGVSGTTWTTKYVAAGPYASSSEWVVEVSIRDLFGKNGYSSSSTVVTKEIAVASESVFMDWKRGLGIGLGKYHTQGFLDVNGDIYQNGNLVVDFTDLATTSLAGLIRLSTNAETVTGTATDRAVTPASFAAGLSAGFAARDTGLRNRIHNGNFRTNQRGYVSGTSQASGVYCFDRWQTQTATNTLTFTSAPQGQAVTISSGDIIRQTIERGNMEAATYVLSWSGTASGRIYKSGAAAPSFAASPITFVNDGLANIVVEFEATGGARTLSQVQVELGTVPSVFEVIPVSLELALCQRYYYRMAPATNGTRLSTVGMQTTTTVAECDVPIPVPMRTSPTIAFTSLYWTDMILFNGVVSAITLYTGGTNNPSFHHLSVTFATNGVSRQGGVISTNGTTGELSFSAEF